MLALNLQRLAVANRNYAFNVHIYADCVNETRLREIEQVRDLFYPEAFLFHAKPHVPAHSGSWNILQAIKSAAQFSDRVYLVEEDVSVFPAFFDWHEAQTAPASCGRRSHIAKRWHEKHGDAYRNPGSCLRRPLLDLLIPHINDAYYTDQEGYCKAQGFPTEKYGSVDDGLICYVLEKAGMQAVYPDKPVCAHQGFFYYGKLDIFLNEETDILKRIERVKEIERLILGGMDPRFKRYAADFEPFNP
jgi:hypothetical protein